MEMGLTFVIYGLFFLLIDLFIYQKVFSRRKDSPSQYAFSLFALIVFVQQAVAVLMTSMEQRVVAPNGFILNACFFLAVILPTLSSYFACKWFVSLFGLNGMAARWKKITMAVPLVLYILMCVVSFKTHWIFFADENLVYHRGTLFFLQIAVPYSYLAATFALLFYEKQKRRDLPNYRFLKFILLYAVPPILGSCFQIFVDSRGNFFSIGISVGLLLTYIGMYMGNQEELRHVKDLADFNEKLQFANDQMRRILMRGELQAKTVAETIHGGFRIGKFDKYFTFKYISEQLAQMLGYTVEEMKNVSGGNMAGLVDVEEVKRQLPAAKALVAEGKMFTLYYKVRCKDGSWKHVEERGRLIRSEGAEDEIWSVTVDKDEMVQVETALAKAEKSRKRLSEYNEIISNAGMGIWFVTLRNGLPDLLHGNDKFYELLGVDGESMSQEELHEFFVSRIVPEDVSVFAGAISKMKDGQFAEALYRWNHPTLGVVYNRCGGTGKRLPDGSFSLSGYHGDATEIVSNEQEQQALLKGALVAAEESNRAKTSFLNNMSHDIRTPMNAILGFATLMEKDCEKPDKIREHLKKVKNAGDFLLSLINNVLEMARIESGKAEINEAPTCLSDNTGVTLDIFEASIRERNLTVTANMDIQHNYVYADIVKLREIVVNLISNAIKYSKQNGRIETCMVEVPCSRDGYAAYKFVVEDDGIGMSEEFLPHVFDSFVRERNSTESKIIGTGLGLPIVKKLVDLMGGTITVESTLGKGSKFTTYFEHRICSESDVARKNGGESLDRTLLENRRVLLVEDNDLNAEIAETLLKDANLNVDRAVDGLDCLERLSKASAGYYDVILMDIQMPNMDGYETTRRIRLQEDELLKGIPIVAMTANAFEEDRRAALAAGMNDHVAKPIDIDVLLKTLANILKK